MIATKIKESIFAIDLEIEHMELNDHAYTKEYRKLKAARRSLVRALKALSFSEVD